MQQPEVSKTFFERHLEKKKSRLDVDKGINRVGNCDRVYQQCLLAGGDFSVHLCV